VSYRWRDDNGGAGGLSAQVVSSSDEDRGRRSFGQRRDLGPGVIRLPIESEAELLVFEMASFPGGKVISAFPEAL